MTALADLRALAEQALENPTLTTQGELHAFADARAVLALVEVAEAAQEYVDADDDIPGFALASRYERLAAALAGLGITAEEPHA